MAAKVGCTSPKPGQPPALQAIEENMSIPDAVKMFCGLFSVPHPERYQLYDEEHRTVVNEENRKQVLKNGAVFKLQLNAEAVADDMISKLTSTLSKDQEEALKMLAGATERSGVSERVVASGAYFKLFEYVDLHRKKPESASAVGHALKSLYNLLHIKAVAVSCLQERPNTVDQLMDFLKNQSKASLIQQYSLLLLAMYVSECKEGLARFTARCTVDDVIEYIKGDNPLAQEDGLALLNAVLRATTGSVPRQQLFAHLDKLRVIPAIKALSRRSERNIGLSDFCRDQLYIFQVLWLGRLADRCRYSFNPADQACIDKLDKLTRVLDAPDAAASNKVANARKLGFTNPKQPELDFQSPPGVLTLDALSEFVDIDQQEYEKLVMEQDSRPEGYACPVVKMAQSVLTVLLDLLDAGKEPKKDGKFVPVLYDKPNAFYQVFVKAMQLAARTWREMEARTADFDKVVHMVRQQLKQVMGDDKNIPIYLDDFEKALSESSYAKMLKDQENEEKEVEGRQMQAEPVTLLKRKLHEEMKALVQEQRLAHMATGCWFTPWVKGKPKKDLKFFAMLSQNHKTLKWGDPVGKDDMVHPNFSSLQHSCDTVDFKVLYTGEDVPEVAQSRRKDDTVVKQTFAVLGAGMDTDHVIFQASLREVAAMWIDGIRSLMDEEMKENETLKEINSLLNLEVRLSLLNLHGIELPRDKPEVPPPPSDFNFVYQADEDVSSA
eukprot:m.92457 g.92457  ORF g.92457 m.92457 type:complete len:721 (+) comp14946_c0_seq1:167-2329(+)